LVTYFVNLGGKPLPFAKNIGLGEFTSIVVFSPDGRNPLFILPGIQQFIWGKSAVCLAGLNQAVKPNSNTLPSQWNERFFPCSRSWWEEAPGKGKLGYTLGNPGF